MVFGKTHLELVQDALVELSALIKRMCVGSIPRCTIRVAYQGLTKRVRFLGSETGVLVSRPVRRKLFDSIELHCRYPQFQGVDVAV